MYTYKYVVFCSPTGFKLARGLFIPIYLLPRYTYYVLLHAGVMDRATKYIASLNADRHWL